MTDITPPLLSNEDLSRKLELFERTVATCLCVVPILFSGQCLVMAYTSPILADALKDFGSNLPWVTQIVIYTRPCWVLAALIIPATALFVARKRPAAYSVVFSTICGLAVFLLAQFITFSLFLPIYQLASVAGGLSK